MPTPKRTRRKAFLPALFTTVLTIVGLGLAGLFVAHRYLDPQASFEATLSGIFNPVQAPQALFHKDRLAILLLGIDYNYDDKDQEYSSGARSDTIMAMSLDLPSRSLHIISIPRDMEYTYADGHVDKINGAYSAGGPHAAQRAVAKFLGIPGFDRYIVLRINATKELVDAIGGIDVPVTETLNYDDTWGHLHIHFAPGLTHMNGEEAVSYSRFRHDACSDPCRIKRQQQVLRLTIAKLKGDKLNDLTHISQLINVVNRNVMTDLSNDERVSLAGAYSNFNMSNLQTDQIPYVDDHVVANGGDVLVPDTNVRDRLVQKYFLAPVAVAPDASSAAAVAAIAPSRVHVRVENGSGISGLGKHVADRLAQAGYVIDFVGNATTFDHDTSEIHVSADASALGERLREAIPAPAAAISTDAQNPAGKIFSRIVIGRDLAFTGATAKP